MKKYKICFGDAAPGQPGTGYDESFSAEHIVEAETYEEAKKEAKKISIEKYFGDFHCWIEEIKET